MKKVTLLAIALLLVAGTANAQFIGLYTDDTRTSWCVSNASQSYIVEV